MRLINQKYNFEIELKENHAYSLIIEKPSIFSDCIHDIWMQCNGGEGAWILSDKEKILAIPKCVDFVVNPWALDINSKKVITKLYAEIEELRQIQFLDVYTEINAKMYSLVDEIINKLPYRIDMNYDIDFVGLLKLYNVHFDQEDITILEKITTYIKIMHQVCSIDTFVFAGLKNFFEKEEIVLLHKEGFREKVNLIMIESKYDQKLETEIVKIIDKDMCIIDL